LTTIGWSYSAVVNLESDRLALTASAEMLLKKVCFERSFEVWQST
jgi:hypothetical protein